MTRGLLLVSVALCLARGTAYADDADVELKPKLLAQQGPPTLFLHAHVPIAQAVLELEGGGKAVHQTIGPLQAGKTARFTLSPGEGPVAYKGTLTLKYPPRAGKDDAQLPLDFVAEVVKPMALAVAPTDVDLARRTLTFTATRPAASAELSLQGLDGRTLAERTVDLHGAAAGTRLTVEWAAVADPIFKLHLQVTDPDGFYAGVDLFPWRVDVPHEEVVFASGASTIPADQASKLDAALAQMLPQVQSASRFVEVGLYVVGHTDTVGGEAANQQLSEARARSIAGYFRAHGLRIPISYAGLGERGLRVPTADEVPEARNRRAEYVLSVNPPTIAGAGADLGWKRF